MHHGTWALLNQTLRADSRKLSTFLFLLAFVGYLFLMTMLASASSDQLGAAGLTLFTAITWMNFICILLAGLGYFSKVLSEEKEESTLELFKLVGVGPVVLMLGKSTSQLILALIVLALQLPFTQLAITLGGVTLSQILAVYLGLAAFTVLIANLGLFWSAISSSDSSAASGMFLCYLMAGVGLNLLHRFFAGPINPMTNSSEWYSWLLPLGQFLVDESIPSRLSRILATGYDGTIMTPQVLVNLLGGVCLFFLSSLLFETQVKAKAEKGSGPSRKRTFRIFSETKQRKVSRPWENPVAWKEYHFQCGGNSRLVLKTFLYFSLFLVVGIICLITSPVIRQQDVAIFLIFGGLLLFGVELFFHAHNLFSTEIKNQTWQNLYLASDSISGIAWQKILGCLLHSLPTLIFVLAGILVAPEMVSKALLEDQGIIIVLTFWVVFLVAFLPLVTYLSLEMKRGSLVMNILLLLLALSCFGWMVLLFAFCSSFLVIKKLKELAAG